MIEGKKIYAVIPARGGSRRLKRKNIYPIWGKPMLYWSVRACQQSAYIDEVFISTEDAEIAQVARDCGAQVIERPEELAGDRVFKQDVIVHAAENFVEKPDIVISLQANSPQLCARDLDAALEKFVKYNRSEIFSVNADLIQNAAFRIMKYDYVFQKSLSTYCGVHVADYMDVHDQDDVDYLEANARPCINEE